MVPLSPLQPRTCRNVSGYLTIAVVPVDSGIQDDVDPQALAYIVNTLAHKQPDSQTLHIYFLHVLRVNRQTTQPLHSKRTVYGAAIFVAAGLDNSIRMPETCRTEGPFQVRSTPYTGEDCARGTAVPATAFAG